MPPTATYVVLAEDRQTALCLREDELEPRVLVYDQIDDEVEGSSDTLFGALELAIGARGAQR